MSIFEYTSEELLGTVESVDTSTIIVKVENDDKLRGLQVNHLICIQSSKIGQHLIGLVSKIIRKSAYSDPTADISPELGFNIIKVILIGTHFDRSAGKEYRGHAVRHHPAARGQDPRGHDAAGAGGF